MEQQQQQHKKSNKTKKEERKRRDKKRKAKSQDNSKKQIDKKSATSFNHEHVGDGGPLRKRSRQLVDESVHNSKHFVAEKTAASDNGQEATSRHPFQVDETDHCETPLQAYKDVVALLDQVAKSLGKSRSSLVLYDPYYCDGGIKRKLQSLQFTNVINKNEDFYRAMQQNRVPAYDVLITNPPYSGQHIEKLLTFVAAHGKKPFLLLLPHFVYTKDYYTRALNKDIASKIFFLVPKTRYSYTPPSWVKASSGSTALAKGKTQTAPFPSFWYCRTPSINDKWLVKTYSKSGKYDPSKPIQYANCTEHIPRDAKGEFDVTKKRPNPRARKRAAKIRKQQQQQQQQSTR